MNAKTIEIILAVSAVFALSGAEVQTIKGSGSQNVSIMDVATWGIDAFSADDDYIVVHDGVTVVAASLDSAKTVTFPGNSLRLRKQFQPSINANYTLNFPRAGLFFDQGGTLRSWITAPSPSPYTITVTGTCITVTAPDNNPASNAARLLATSLPQYRTTYDFRAPFVGARNTMLLMQQYSNASYPGKSTLRLLNDCTNFFGTIYMNGNDSELVLGTPEFPGTVRLHCNPSTGSSTLTALDGVNAVVGCVTGTHANVTLAIPKSASFTVGDLVLMGGTISFAATGSGTNSSAAVLAVTNRLAISSPVTIRYPAAAAAFRAAPLDDLAAAVTVLTLPVGKGTLSVNDFTLDIEAQPGVCGKLPHNPYLAVRTVDGVQRLVVAYDQPVVVQLVADYSNAGGSSFKEANKGRWSDGELPGPGKHYFVPAGIQLMTLNGVQFTGESLTVAGTLAICATPFEGASFVFLGGANIYEYVADPVVNAPVTLLGSDPVKVRPTQGHTLTFAQEVSGTAPFRLLYYEEGGVGRNTGVSFSQANPSYFGKIDFGLANSSQSSDFQNGNTHLRLFVSDPLELGGPLPSFAYEALTLNNRLGVEALNSLTFSDQTRGVYIYGGRVDVPAEKQLGFAQPFTWRGSLWKYGAGTFAVGGPSAPRFFHQGAIHDTPTTATVANRMSVMEGGLKALTTNALDGCELEIKSGASLVLDADPTDADVRTYGFVNAKWNAPFLLPDGMTTVPVTFDFGGKEPSFAQRTLGICTVKSDATGVSKSLFAPVRPKHYDVKVLSEANAATGLTTYSVQLVREGFMVIFR